MGFSPHHKYASKYTFLSLIHGANCYSPIRSTYMSHIHGHVHVPSTYTIPAHTNIHDLQVKVSAELSFHQLREGIKNLKYIPPILITEVKYDDPCAVCALVLDTSVKRQSSSHAQPHAVEFTNIFVACVSVCVCIYVHACIHRTHMRVLKKQVRM
jgi:hypothetical protein